jgi:hypothetical protein
MFKKLFGSLDHPALTLHFVNAILKAAHLHLAVDNSAYKASWKPRGK